MVMNGVILIHHRHAESRGFEQLVIVGIGLHQSRFDTALPNGHHRKAQSGGHFNKTEDIAVQRIKHGIHHTDGQHRNGQPNHFLGAGNAATLDDLADHQGNAGKDPHRSNIVQRSVLINVPARLVPLVKAKGPLMQIIAQNARDHQNGGRVHQIPYFGQPIILRLSDILCGEQAELRNQDHGGIVGVPAPHTDGIDVEKDRMPQGTHQHPEHHQPHQHNEVAADAFIDDALVHRDAPEHQYPKIDRQHHHVGNDVHGGGGTHGNDPHEICKQQQKYGQQDVDGIGGRFLLPAHQPLLLHRTVNGQNQTFGKNIGHRQPFKAAGQKLFDQPDGDIAQNGTQQQNRMTVGFDLLFGDGVKGNARHTQHIADQIHVIKPLGGIKNAKK